MRTRARDVCSAPQGLGESLVLEGPRPAAGGGGAKVDHRVIPLGGADVMQQLQQVRRVYYLLVVSCVLVVW